MVEGYAALVQGNSDGGFPEKLTVGVVSHFLWSPVEAVLVVGLIRAEAHGVKVGNKLACRGGVNYEEDGCFVWID